MDRVMDERFAERVWMKGFIEQIKMASRVDGVESVEMV